MRPPYPERASIIGFEGLYEVSEDGVVYSLGRFVGYSKQEIILKPEVTKFGYYRVALCCNGKTHKNVIVSNTSTTEKELKPYLALAEEYGYAVTSIIVENRHGGQSIHNVPQETIDEIRARSV